MPEHERDGVQKMIASVMESHKPLRYENTAENVKGETLVLEWTNIPILNADGKVIEFHSVGRDVTRERRAAGKEKVLHKKLATLFEFMPDMLVLMSTDGTIVDVNPTLQQRLGYRRDEVVGQLFTFLCPNKDPDSTGRILREVAKEGLNTFGLSLRCRNGEVIEAEISTTLVPWDGTDVIMGTLRDVGAEKTNGKPAVRRQMYNRMLYDLSSRPLNVSVKSLDEIINRTLVNIGHASNADRAYFFQLGGNDRFVRNSHEWCAEGVSPEIDHLQNIPVASIPWWISTLRKHRLVTVDEVLKMPSEAKAEQQILLEQGIQSVLVAPIADQGSLVGFVGLDSVRQKRTWNKDDQLMLKAAADIIWQTLVHYRQETGLEASHFEFEEALSGANLGFWWWDIPSGEVNYNGQWCRMLGYGREEIEPRLESWQQRIHPEDLHQAVETLDRFLQGSTLDYDLNPLDSV